MPLLSSPSPRPSPKGRGRILKDALTSDPISWPADYIVPPESAGWRLDVFLADVFPQFSRATLRRAIDAGGVRRRWRCLQGVAAAARRATVVVVHQLDVPREGPQPQNIPLDILHEDDAIVVVNKPAGMIVHPAKGHWEGTLASALAHHFGPLSGRGGPTRPGIVHRLDRDTSGVIVVAKNDQAHDALAAQFKSRQRRKGVPGDRRRRARSRSGCRSTSRLATTRRSARRRRSARATPSSREAATVYEVVERFAGFALVRARPKTGRTHQIRLHLAHVGYPVLCDRLYGGRAKITELELIPRGPNWRKIRSPRERLASHIVLDRQALHAHRLSFDHPTTGERCKFEAPLPARFG